MRPFFKKSFVFLPFVCALVFISPSEANARGAQLAVRTVASWDGPETKGYMKRVRTGSYPKCRKLKCRKEPTYADVPAIDLRRHRIVATMYGPDNISNPDQQLKQISNSCLISGLVLAGIPAVAAAPVGLSAQTLQKGVEVCLLAQNLGSQLVAPGFEVTIEEMHYFEH